MEVSTMNLLHHSEAAVKLTNKRTDAHKYLKQSFNIKCRVNCLERLVSRAVIQCILRSEAVLPFLGNTI